MAFDGFYTGGWWWSGDYSHTKEFKCRSRARASLRAPRLFDRLYDDDSLSLCVSLERIATKPEGGQLTQRSSSIRSKLRRARPASALGRVLPAAVSLWAIDWRHAYSRLLLFHGGAKSNEFQPAVDRPRSSRLG
jgi:hypothetical protein